MKLLVVFFAIYIAWLSGSIKFLADSEVRPQEGTATVQAVNNAHARGTRSTLDAKELRKIIAFSQEGHGALLGGRWLTIDGQLKSLTFPEPLLYPSPIAFFDARTVLLYAHRTDSAAGALALFDTERGSFRDIALLTEEPHAPAPSPDKRYVAFVSARGRLQVVDLDNHKSTDISPAWDSAPSWAPNGDSIVFEKNREHDRGWAFSEVAVASLASGNVAVLCKGRSPSWSPKGDLIAFTDVDGKQLELIDSHGGHRRVLKKNLAAIMGPLVGPLVWSPDARKLIFHRFHDSPGGDEHTQVYVIDTNTGATKALLKDEVVLGWR